MRRRIALAAAAAAGLLAAAGARGQWAEKKSLTIEGARKKLRELGVARALDAAPAEPEPEPRAALARIRAELLAIRAAL